MPATDWLRQLESDLTQAGGTFVRFTRQHHRLWQIGSHQLTLPSLRTGDGKRALDNTAAQVRRFIKKHGRAIAKPRAREPEPLLDFLLPAPTGNGHAPEPAAAAIPAPTLTPPPSPTRRRRSGPRPLAANRRRLANGRTSYVLKWIREADGQFHCPKCAFTSANHNGIGVHYGARHEAEKVFRCRATGCNFYGQKTQMIQHALKTGHTRQKLRAAGDANVLPHKRPRRVAAPVAAPAPTEAEHPAELVAIEAIKPGLLGMKIQTLIRDMHAVLKQVLRLEHETGHIGRVPRRFQP